MSNALFQTQLNEFLTERPAPCNRDIIIEDTQSLMVTRWKDLWIKVPQMEDWNEAKDGYTKAHALGYLDNLHIEGVEIITFHTEGIPVNKSHISLLEELWEKMLKDDFYLDDWHSGNILVTPQNELKVIDWGSYALFNTWSLRGFQEMINNLE